MITRCGAVLMTSWWMIVPKPPPAPESAVGRIIWRVIGAAFIAAGVALLLMVFLTVAHATEERGHLQVGAGLTGHGLFAQLMGSPGSLMNRGAGNFGGAVVVPTFLKFETNGFILLEGGGKLKCESC